AATVFGVREQVTVTGADHQFRRRRPVATKGVGGKRGDRSRITTQGVGVRGGAGVDLTDSAVRVGERTGKATRIRVVPACEQAQGANCLVVHARVGIVLREGAGQLTRARRGKSSGTANCVQIRDVAGEEPQPVLEDRSANFKARLKNGSRVLLRNVV